tara:strand:+ start:75 stop:356 length:282 start_codon:yes stop_codon:yes gene_type:complete
MSLSTTQTSVEDFTPGPLPKTIRAVRDSNAEYGGGRTLVICLDGTGDKFDNDNSEFRILVSIETHQIDSSLGNVVNFVACLKKDDPSQVTYYQ